MAALPWPGPNPILAPPPGYNEARFAAVAVSTAPGLSILFTRVGHEYPDFVRTQDAFVDAVRANGVALDVIEVPAGSMVSTALTTPRTPERLWPRP